MVLRFFLFAVIGVASMAAETIHLKTRDFDPPADRRDYLSQPLERRTPGSSHYLIQFEAPVSAEMIERLRARGIVVTSYVGRSTLMVAAPDDFSLAGFPVRWIGRLEHRDKISPLITGQVAAGRAPGAYVVEFHPDVNMSEARAMVREHNLRLIENRYLASHHLLVGGDFGAVSSLAAWDEVAYVFPASPELLAGKHVYPCEGAAAAESTTTGQFGGTGYPWTVTGPNGLTLGYYFSQLTQELPANASQQQILKAFNEWAKYANVIFTSAPSATASQTVNVLFATGAHGDAYPFEGSTILAHTFYPAPLNPEPIAGDMHLNNDERWQIGADIDLYSVALHEAGHALGLVHVDDPNQVMYPYYRMRTGLGTGDIAVVQSYYGAAAGATPSQPAPAPLTLTVQSPAANFTTTASTVSVSGVTSGGVAPVEVAWSTANGEIGNALGSASWNIPSLPLSLGVNNITITAFDAASHIVTQTISVTQQAQQAPPSKPAPSAPSAPPSGSPGNTAPPSLCITNPASTIVSTTAATITFQGMATDNAGVTSVTWSTSTGASGTATGTLTWTAQNIPLLVGSNTVTISAYDAAGNSAWRSVTVVRTGN